MKSRIPALIVLALTASSLLFDFPKTITDAYAASTQPKQHTTKADPPKR